MYQVPLKMQEMSDKSGDLSSFWSAKEAQTFQGKISETLSNLSEFMTKYEDYMSFLDSVISSYSEDNTNLINSIKAIAAGNENGNGKIVGGRGQFTQ